MSRGLVDRDSERIVAPDASMTRRRMISTAVQAGISVAVGSALLNGNAPHARAQVGRVIKLPPPQAAGGGDVISALKARKSTRAYSTRPLPREVLSTVLWAASGVNRSTTGGRTAPAAHRWYEIDVYAALADGFYLYDPKAHALTLTVARDLRPVTGVQDFVATAPLDLVYVANVSRMPNASEEDRTFYAAADTAVMAENVYLLCAGLGLATVVRSSVPHDKLGPAMGIRPEQRIVLSQTVGFPA